jgi:uncharacterized membrane-anchored protein YhcB (DUF1043 family)
MRKSKMFKLFNKSRIRRAKLFTSKAQSTLEYAIIITVVIAALTAMSVYVQRAIQSQLKMVEKQVNNEPK